MLELRAVSAGYGPVDVVRGVDVALAEGGIVAVVGPNGAGKTTLLRVVCGLLHQREGSVVLDGEDLRGHGCAQRVKRGVVMVPEGRQIFSGLTVEENLGLGAYGGRLSGRELREQLEVVFELFPMLGQRRTLAGGLLSGGQQQMLAIGRGLMAKPRYLLLDEPSLGLAPIVVESIFACVTELAATGLGILLVEQNATMALAAAGYGYVLQEGRIVDSGTDLLERSTLVDQYLGTEGAIVLEHAEAMTTSLREVLGDLRA